MDTFNERITRLAELDDAELDALIVEMVTAFDAADAAGDIDQMQAIADGLDQARAQQATRTSAPAEEAPVAPEAIVEEVPLAASAETEADTPSEAAEPEAPEAETPAVEVDVETDAAEVEVEVPVEPAAEPADDDTPNESAADAAEKETPVEQLTADEVPEENAPTVASAPPVTIRAGGDIPGITSGTELAGMDDIVDALTKKVNAMRGVSGDGEQITVASMRVEGDLPDERVLRAGDANGNSKKIRALIADRDALTRDALVAAAWCAPRAPIYDVPTMGISDRPVAGGLPTFNADRGGATWMQPPALPDLSPAVALWTYDEDEGRWESRTNPDGTGTSALDKPSLAVPCGNEMYADVEAVTQQLCFDNMTARAFPEWIRGNTDLTLVAQARFAEQHLLARMFGPITAEGCGTPGIALGAARDFLTTVKLTAAAKRWRFRLGATAPLQLFAPSWLAEAIALDLMIQAPGDDTLDTAYTEVDGYLRAANIDPVWFIDDAPGQDPFDSCSSFPADAHWLLFPTGTFIRLDTGSLDLGVVRSKEDIARNTYCQFVETFETAAYMGPADPNGWATHGVTPIGIQGNTGGPVDTSGSTEGS